MQSRRIMWRILGLRLKTELTTVLMINPASFTLLEIPETTKQFVHDERPVLRLQVCKEMMPACSQQVPWVLQLLSNA